MKINYYAKDGKLYNSNRDEVVPDENGMITIVFAGGHRRFVRDKFLKYLENSPHVEQFKPPYRKTDRRWGKVAAAKVRDEKTIRVSTPQEPKTDRRRRIVKPRPTKTDRRRGVRKVKEIGVKPHASVAKRLAVKMIDPDGKVYGPFESISKCARELKISKSQISKYVRGTMVNSDGYRFEKVEKKTA